VGPMREGLRGGFALILGVAALLSGANSCSSESIQGIESLTDGLVVSSVVPAESPRGLTIDLHVHGSGFEAGSEVSLEQHGIPSDAIRTNETRFVSSQELEANVTISQFAPAGLYDLVVLTPTRKRGIGLETFRVTVISVGTLPGGVASVAYDVNGNDEVVGSVQIGFPDDEGFDDWHATFWSMGVLEDLGRGTAFSISGDCAPGACRVAGAREDLPVIWQKQDGAWSVLELPVEGGIGSASAINGRGDRVGGNLWNGASGVAAVWSESSEGEWRVEELSPAADDANAYGINDAGLVVGRAAGNAVVWTNEGGQWRSQVLAPLPGDAEAIARSVNERGDVVGASGPFGGRSNRAVLWRRTSSGWDPPIELIPVVPGGPVVERSSANDINESGQVVGSVVYGERDLFTSLRGLAQQRAFLWTEEIGIIDLGLLDDRGTIAFALNDQGHAVGSNSELALLWIVSAID
jgi:hypothetical protein